MKHVTKLRFLDICGRRLFLHSFFLTHFWNVAVLYFVGYIGGRDLCQGFQTQLLQFKRHFPCSRKPDCASVTSRGYRTSQLPLQPAFLPSRKRQLLQHFSRKGGVTPISELCHIQNAHTRSAFALRRLLLLLNQTLVESTVYSRVSLPDCSPTAFICQLYPQHNPVSEALLFLPFLTN